MCIVQTWKRPCKFPTMLRSSLSSLLDTVRVTENDIFTFLTVTAVDFLIMTHLWIHIYQFSWNKKKKNVKAMWLGDMRYWCAAVVPAFVHACFCNVRGSRNIWRKPNTRWVLIINTSIVKIQSWEMWGLHADILITNLMIVVFWNIAPQQALFACSPCQPDLTPPWSQLILWANLDDRESQPRRRQE